LGSYFSRFRKHRSPPSGYRPLAEHAEYLRRKSHRAAIEALEPRALLAATVVADYAVTQNWGSGFEGQITLTNQQAVAVPNWTLEFDFGASITSIWDGRIISHTGTHYVVANAGWNSNLAAGGQAEFGFIAAPAIGPASPVNYTLNGKSLSGTTPPPSLPTISVADVSINEGNSGTKNETFTVTLSAAATSNVTVNYATRNDTALAGSDYTATSGKLTFSPGQTSKTVNVGVLGDAVFESDEDFFLDLSAPVGATLARATATGTITNDDAQPPPPTTGGNVPASAQFSVTNDWINGFNGDVTIQNTGASTIHGWKVQFNFNGQISSIWNASILSHSGNVYVVQPANWNTDIAAGQTIDFGFTGNPGGVAAVLKNFVITGTVETGTSGGTNGGTTGGTTGTTGTSQSLNTSTIAWPTHYYAPYVDSTLWPLYDFVGAARSSGVKFFTLAFITADPANKPAWGGFAAYDVGNSDFDTQMKSNIAALRTLGGDVMVSFGGAANQELAQGITNVSSLTAAYQSVITTYGLTHIDFDIEGAAVADHASIDRRSQAIAQLQQAATAAGRKLDVWFTLPVLPTGLTADGLYVIQSALRYGVNIAGVNIMTMDYGDSAAPSPAEHMGDFAIQAATSLFGQLQTAYNGTQTDAQLWGKIGLTPMIGMNDIQSEVFTPQDAQKMLAFAQQHGIDRISIWSLNRDYQNSAGAINYVDNFSSSLLQSPLEFSLLLNQLTG
jgi:Cellulose binding domain/Calx-beta domain/Glycosyl hydrolases family 18